MFLSRLSHQQKDTFFRLAYSVAVSDGEMTEGESNMLDEMRKEMNIDAETIPTYQDIKDTEGVFDSRQSRSIALISLIQLGFADGAYEIEEQCYVNDLRKFFGTGDKEFNVIANWVKRLVSLEQEANAFM